MSLEKRSSSNTVYLQAKHYCLWQELKKPTTDSETVEVTNPKTGVKLNKYGYGYNTLNARVTKIVKYDTEKQYATRYFGFKMHMDDGDSHYVFDMPYNSQALRRFLLVAPNVDWSEPLSITAFKGKKKDAKSTGADPLVVWFRQHGETVKAYFTREAPNGMPDAIHDDVSGEWDFREQRRWLVKYLQERIIPAIAEAAQRMAPPDEPAFEPQPEQPPLPDDYTDPYAGHGITDDDVPF